MILRLSHPSPVGLTRRQLVQSALGLAGLGATGMAPAAVGRVLFGLMPDQATAPMFTAVLKDLQGRYLPDLGTKVTYLPGNTSGVAIEAAHRSPADGSTALLAPSSMLTLVPYLRKLATVDPVTDLTPVAGIGEVTVVFAIGPTVPAGIKTLKDYARWVHDNPISGQFGVLGLGSASHFLGNILARWADAPLKAVAYKGMASLTDDLAFGNLPGGFMATSGAIEAAAEGRVRLLAVCSDQRWPGMADVPTLRELGVTDVVAMLSYGFFMPAATPAVKQQELAAAVRQACSTPAVVAALVRAALRPMSGQGADYPAVVARERAVWGEVLKTHRFTVDS